MELLESWRRSLRAANLSPATIDAYLTDATKFEAQLGRDITTTKRADVEAYLAAAFDQGLAPATVARRYRSLLQLFRWMVDEEEIAADPMAKMKPPKVTETPPPVIADADMTKLLAACTPGNSRKAGGAKPGAPNDEAKFTAARDLAILSMMATTGVRAAEIMGLAVTDVDLTAQTFTVIGKGNRLRNVALLTKPAEALDRYLRRRRKHRHHALPNLWLSDRGALTASGLRQLLERRCDQAGIGRINPHRFRHTFAHQAKVRGMSDEQLMVVAGWRSAQMLNRYGASAAAKRAEEAHRRLFDGGDR